MTDIHSIIDKCMVLYTEFDLNAVARLADIYHCDVVFSDPIHQVQGLHSLKNYFEHICGGSESHFEFTASLKDGDQAFLRWNMHYSHPKLAGGKALTLKGGSFLTIHEPSNLIIAQEDYYDMGQMVYRHIPVLGWAVNKINANLATNNKPASQIMSNEYAK